jgi:lysophospholipase L1-like esterase
MTIATNLHRSREKTFKVPVPAKVIALGDSFIYGYGDNLGGGWVERLKRQWMNDGPVLYNLGVRGDRTKDALLRLEQEYSVRGELRNQFPELIILSVGLNDTPRLGKPNGKPYTNQEDFQKNIQTLLEVASRLCQVVFVGMVPVDESKMPFAGCLYYNHLDQSVYSEITKQACLERDIPYLDLFRNSPTIELSNDGLHPNPAGHIKILEQVCNWEPIKQLSSQSAKL